MARADLKIRITTEADGRPVAWLDSPFWWEWWKGEWRPGWFHTFSREKGETMALIETLDGNLRAVEYQAVLFLDRCGERQPGCERCGAELMPAHGEPLFYPVYDEDLDTTVDRGPLCVVCRDILLMEDAQEAGES